MPRYNRIHSLVQQIAMSAPGAALGARLMHHCDRVLLALTGQRVTFGNLITGLPVVMLTTRGARSGQRRTLPLLGIPDPAAPEQLAVIATNWGQKHYPGWYYNLKANPRATVRVHGQSADYTANELAGEEYARFWKLAVDVYAGYALYRERIGAGRRIPIMLLWPIR